MMNEISDRMKILEMIESGEISAEDGLRLLKEINHTDEITSENNINAAQTLPAEEQFQESVVSEVEALDAGGDETSRFASNQINQADEPQSEFEAFDTQSKDVADLKMTEYTEPYASDDSEDWQNNQYSAEAPEPPHRPKAIPDDVNKWRRWWMIPLWIGVGITVLGGLFMLWAYYASGLGFWFFCTSLFFAFGLLVMVLAAQSRTARWLHLRVKQRPGERPRNIAISFPLPIRFSSWIIRIFGRYIPNVQGASANDLLQALDAVDDTVSVENPIYIEVDDEDGERVEIYIG